MLKVSGFKFLQLCPVAVGLSSVGFFVHWEEEQETIQKGELQEREVHFLEVKLEVVLCAEKWSGKQI